MLTLFLNHLMVQNRIRSCNGTQEMPTPHTASAPLPGQLPAAGLVRLRQILAPEGPIPLSANTFMAEVRAGRFPQPVPLSRRAKAWKVEDIMMLAAEGCQLRRLDQLGITSGRGGTGWPRCQPLTPSPWPVTTS
jgi:predicted DNA-binding transcriptional regulator AlpA